jgi:dynein heavy chain
MGEGQERVARKAIENGAAHGSWVILQNCHLGLGFMEEIETLIVPEGPFPIHEDFRLWITCEQHPRFPLGLLQKTLKVTNEPPKGLRAGLYKTFTTIITQEFLDKVDHPNWRNLIFTACFLHSVVIERRKFGPLGWCIPYEYNYSDLEASLSFIEKYLTNLMSTPQQNQSNLPISMSVVRYMICEVQYGGRITDDLDRELFNAYGDDYLKDNIFGGEHVFAEIQNDTGAGARERFKYKIPQNPSSEIQKYVDYVNTVPPTDNPEVFGLHSNADLTFRLKESLEMINTIMETRPKDSSVGGGKTREEIVQEKAKELLSKLINRSIFLITNNFF